MTFPKLPSPIRFATAIVLVTTITAVQTVAAQEASAVTDAIRRIQSDDLGSQPENRLMYVNILASARAVEAIPVLESYYARITDAEIKAGVASALVRLGDKKDIYRDYFVADAIKHIRSNNVGQGPVDAMSYVNPIANAGAAEGIPVLEDYYARTTDAEIKAGVASALVRLGDKNQVYWTFLATLATPAAESDAPTPFEFGGQKAVFSPEFKAWATKHQLSFEAAYTLVAQDLPLALSALARTGDPRGVPLLRKALTSPNLFIASVAAAGLAQANDLSSVPVIIDACKRLPPKMAGLLADSLLFFDDPQAQSTFASYFPTINISEEEYSAEACSRVFRSIRNKGSGKVSLQTFTRRVHS